MEPVLEVRNIFKSFGGIHALINVDFSLYKGEIHAILGANGAGKSTLIKILTGYQKPDSGKIIINGKELAYFQSTRESVKYGISAVYQEFSLINTLSVAENIFIGALPKNYGIVDWKNVIEKSSEILAWIGVRIEPKKLVKDLSVANKQIVEIAKALSKNSKILIMDEPTSALGEDDIQSLFNVIKGLRKNGISIIYVSHKLEELYQITNCVTIFRDGKNITSLPMRDIGKELLIKHMVGKDIEIKNGINTKKLYKDKLVFSLNKITKQQRFYDVSFDIHEGEIVGLTGFSDSGCLDLTRVLFGIDKIDSGDIVIHGILYKNIHSPIQAKKIGLGFVTENRKEEGLVLQESIKNNLLLTILYRFSKFFIIQNRKIFSIANEHIEKLQIKCSGSEQKVLNLSGGNQQKVVIAKWLATNPTILIFNEPTRGIDVNAKDQIYGILRSLAKKGVAILVMSSEIPEILSLSDRILVMANGHITLNQINDNIDQNMILYYQTIHL